MLRLSKLYSGIIIAHAKAHIVTDCSIHVPDKCILFCLCEYSQSAVAHRICGDKSHPMITSRSNKPPASINAFENEEHEDGWQHHQLLVDAESSQMDGWMDRRAEGQKSALITTHVRLHPKAETREASFFRLMTNRKQTSRESVTVSRTLGIGTLIPHPFILENNAPLSPLTQFTTIQNVSTHIICVIHQIKTRLIRRS